jgi:hypothetical protein
MAGSRYGRRRSRTRRCRTNTCVCAACGKAPPAMQSTCRESQSLHRAVKVSRYEETIAPQCRTHGALAMKRLPRDGNTLQENGQATAIFFTRQRVRCVTSCQEDQRIDTCPNLHPRGRDRSDKMSRLSPARTPTFRRARFTHWKAIRPGPEGRQAIARSRQGRVSSKDHGAQGAEHRHNLRHERFSMLPGATGAFRYAHTPYSAPTHSSSPTVHFAGCAGSRTMRR